MIFGIKEEWIILTHTMYCWLLLQIYLCYLWLLLCSRVTFADLLLEKHFWLSSMLRTVVLPNIFGETRIYIFFRIHRWIESSKEQHLFEMEIFCNMSLLSLLINLMCYCSSTFPSLILVPMICLLCCTMFISVSHSSVSLLSWWAALCWNKSIKQSNQNESFGGR